MTRYIAKSGDKTLEKIDDNIWMSRSLIGKNLSRLRSHQYETHVLITEDFSELLQDTYRIWEIDGKYRRVVFRSGVTYTEEELAKLSRLSQELVRSGHFVKKTFSGKIV